MWDNQATMHRARSFDDEIHPRDLRRTTLTTGQPALPAHIENGENGARPQLIGT
jgi:alpha-ketoglutarate-dependent taurine dioxygenase